MKQLPYIMALAAAMAASAASAQDDTGADATDGLDLTMALMPADAVLPDVVTALIELPKDEGGELISSAEGVENSAQGLEKANLAHADGRAFGEAAATAAQDNREDFGRGSMPDLESLLPDNVPSIPESPELPETPAPR